MYSAGTMQARAGLAGKLGGPFKETSGRMPSTSFADAREIDGDPLGRRRQKPCEAARPRDAVRHACEENVYLIGAVEAAARQHARPKPDEAR